MSPRVLSLAVGFCLTSALPVLAGFQQITYTGDLDSGISSALNYTAKSDFAGNGTTTINGVTFSETSGAGNGYALAGPGNTFTGFANNLTGGANTAVSNFVYGSDGAGLATLTLTGLTPGQRYATTWYNAGFGGAGGRLVNITPGDGGAVYNFDQNFSGAGAGNLLRYLFTATSASMTYAFDAVSDGDTFHHYAFTNHAVTSAGPVVTSVTGAGPGFSPFTVSNNDLLQTSVLGAPVANGNFSMDGPENRIAALTNGLFLINGGNPADNAQLLTAGNNFSVSYALDTTLNTLGYDVSSFNIYGGWNDSGRDKQFYNISYSKVGSDEWIPFDSLEYEPTAGGEPSAVSAVFAASLTGVDGVRLDFPNLQENGYAGIGEFDVIGTPTVPEPAVSGLAALVGLGAIARRRR